MKGLSLLASSILIGWSLVVVDAFVLLPQKTSFVIAPLYGNSFRGESFGAGDSSKRNRFRTDIRNFLTQRTLQSFVYLLNQMKDEHTVTWIEKTLNFTKLDSCHGTGALDMEEFPEWDSMFLNLCDLPKTQITVEVKRKRKQHRGLAGSNNYLENLSRPPEEQVEERRRVNPYLEDITTEFDFEIDPASLATRMISVREQISKEWILDLETLMESNEEILTAYEEQQKELRAQHEEEDDNNDDEDEEEDDDTEMRKGEDKDDTEDLQALYSSSLEEEEDYVVPAIVLDRSAMNMLTNALASQDRGSSPLRRPNFDLLLLLSTQESVHRILREYSAEEGSQDSAKEDFSWLKELYTTRVSQYFDGHHHAYGRADDFLGELLRSPPIVKKTKKGIHLIDPMAMTEDILRERSEVAREWKAIVTNASEEHIGLQRLLLTRRMLELADSTLGPTIMEKARSEQQRILNSTEATGAFE